MILAPLRGVTIRCFREIYATAIREAGFDEAFTPFISAMSGIEPLNDRELRGAKAIEGIRLTPQFIGKDANELKRCLERVREAGYETADLNCGCPYPMVRNKGRGSGILRTPKIFELMLKTGCEVMGPNKFSIKARLGVERNDELLGLMPMVNDFPLRFMTVHARNAKQMYEGECDRAALEAVKAAAKVKIVANGDLDWREGEGMVGRSFIRHLGEMEDAREMIWRYVEASRAELSGERPVLGRIKELIAYWKELPQWRRSWNLIKLCRSLDELKSVVE